jgi:hypothetical protein
LILAPVVLATTLIEKLRGRSTLLPRLNVIYKQLTEGLTDVHRHRLDELLGRKEGSTLTLLGWLRQSPLKPNSKHMLEHIDRLQAWRSLDLPAGIEHRVHQNRLLKMLARAAK